MFDETFKTRATKYTPKTSSAVEYYLRSYLSNNLPDILIVIPPFIHDRVYELPVAYKRIAVLVDLVQKYVPSHIRVIWLPQITTWKFSNQTFHSMTADHKSLRLNQELFRLLKTKILNSYSNWYGFYDLKSVNEPLEMFADGRKVHMYGAKLL